MANLQAAVILLILTTGSAQAQSLCPAIDLLNAQTVSLKPTDTSHTVVARQTDGSYTAFDLSDAPPRRVIQTTPHFETRFVEGLPYTLGISPQPPVYPRPGTAAQTQAVAVLPSGNYMVASADSIVVFDRQLKLISGQMNLASKAPVALADLNGDGALDLITITFQSVNHSLVNIFTLWTRLGNGDGSFQTAVGHPLGSYNFEIAVSSFAVGDLNGDGKPDIVIALGGVFIALGNGDGTFGPSAHVASLNLPLYVPPSVAVEDLNGDGALDVVFSPSVSYGVGVALGNGDGTFQATSQYAASIGLRDISAQDRIQLAIGDVNDDGIPDIVTEGGSILLGDGSGGFPGRSDYVSSGSGYVMLSDFDGDGKIDIIIGTGNPLFLTGASVTVLFNQGGSTFLAAPALHVPGGGANPLAAVADFDGDGVPDLALLSSNIPLLSANCCLDILKGDSKGRFRTVFHYDFVFPSNPTGSNAVSISAADLNHDGKPDVIVAFSGYQDPQHLLILLGKGDGTFAAPSTLFVPGGVFGEIHFIAAIDLNQDNNPDLVVLSSMPYSAHDAVWIYLGKSDGTFLEPISYPAGPAVSSVAFGDFNGDGKVDIAVASSGYPAVGLSGNISLLLGRGDGSFLTGANISSVASPNVATFYPAKLISADFNGDGKLDLLTTNLSSCCPFHDGFAVLIGSGDGTFQSPTIYSTPGELTKSFTAADLNGDGILDLIRGSSSGTSALLGNGDGTFQPETVISSKILQGLVTADFNGDGAPDIVGSYGFGVASFLNLSPTRGSSCSSTGLP